MKHRRFKIISVLGFLYVGISAFQNCAATKFDSAVDTSSGLHTEGDPIPGPCQDFTKVSLPLKIIVAIDNTGSTGSNKYGTAVPQGGFVFKLGSDNDQKFRQESIAEFLAGVSGLSNITYTLINFQNLTNVQWRRQDPNYLAEALINNGGNTQSPAFGDVTSMRAAMANYLKITQDGSTEYFSALALIRKAIINDPDFAGGKQSYAVIFLSDGEPTERLQSDGSTVVWDSATDEPDVLREIKDLLDLSPDHISFSTLFFNSLTPQQRAEIILQEEHARDPGDNRPVYDPVDPLAPVLLQKMATAGKGQFGNANSFTQNTFKLSNVITVPNSLCKP